MAVSKHLKHFLALVLVMCTSLFCTQQKKQNGIETEIKEAASKEKYTFYKKGNNKLQFVISRPNKTDAKIKLCIAAAFTKLDNYKIDGAYAVKGICNNFSAANKTLGGGILIEGTSVKIFPTKKGALVNDSLKKTIESNKASFFQQIQMIENGVAAKFKDNKLFQRRGIAILKNGEIAIVESKNAITLKTFADDLVELKVQQLLYTDMGSWDEGWYKNKEGKTITIGTSLAETDKQSNWVIFSE